MCWKCWERWGPRIRHLVALLAGGTGAKGHFLNLGVAVYDQLVQTLAALATRCVARGRLQKFANYRACRLHIIRPPNLTAADAKLILHGRPL